MKLSHKYSVTVFSHIFNNSIHKFNHRNTETITTITLNRENK